MNYSDHTKFEEKIQNLGFSPDVNSKVKVRYKIKGITVDFMPTTDVAIGFEHTHWPASMNYNRKCNLNHGPI